MNPHAVLGVEAGASPGEIKSAYRKLAMEHHPDRNGGSEESARKFQEIQDAYDMLRSDKKPSGYQQQNYERTHRYHSGSMDEMFEQFFRRQQMGNPSMQATCDITLEQAFAGCSMTFTLPTGQQATVDIPAGVDNGQILRVPEGAGAPNPDFPPGDLNIIVRLRPHAVFHRQGMTLLTRVPVDILDIICGCEKEVTTLTGEVVKFTIPENSNPESTIVVEGHGMNRVGGSERGTLIVHLQAQYPQFDEKQLRALRKLQKKS